MDVLFTIARSWHTPKAKSGCTAHEFGKLTHFLRWYGCTVHEIGKLTSTSKQLYAKGWVYSSRFREADIHFGVFWMYGSRYREADTRQKRKMDVPFTISGSWHPFWEIFGCNSPDLEKLTSILKQKVVQRSCTEEVYIHPTTNVHPSHDKCTSIPWQRYIHPTTKVHPSHDKGTSITQQAYLHQITNQPFLHQPLPSLQ